MKYIPFAVDPEGREGHVPERRGHADGERQIVVGDSVDPDNAKATFKNVVLTVIVAKKLEARRQTRIEIN